MAEELAARRDAGPGESCCFCATIVLLAAGPVTLARGMGPPAQSAPKPGLRAQQGCRRAVRYTLGLHRTRCVVNTAPFSLLHFLDEGNGGRD